MNEKLFQYIWQHSLFLPNGLATTTGEKVIVHYPGYKNTNAGPDFLDGRVKIGHAEWAGNIELHLRSSDWKRHAHHEDLNYHNVILHVVLEDDERQAVGNFPTLVLKDHISDDILQKYRALMAGQDTIACSAQIKRFPQIKWQSWLYRLLAERWEDKLSEWQGLWEDSAKDWRQLLYYRLAANFGFHVNKMPFLALAQSLPLKTLAAHRENLLQTEALVLGQSGLLDAVNRPDDYTDTLRNEYHFLRRKYALVPIAAYQWKFMRMRPANFPTVRLAQFAMLIHRSLDLFSKMMEMRSENEMAPLLDIQAGDYWQNHYRFGEESSHKRPKKLGRQAMQNLIINTIAPMQFLYARLQGATDLVDSSVELLQSIPPEDNRILREWKAINIVPKNAAESQALIQLLTTYCNAKKCLDCAVGNFLLSARK
ncbi:MAG TPA: DUF2851 family protein [Edaphocola sp.]|nr:DUF2851 family protein [Edaphocola sp.]